MTKASERRFAPKWRALLLPLFALGGCSHERHDAPADAVVSAPGVEHTLVGFHKVRGSKGDLGYVETWAVGAEKSRALRRVTDLKRTPLGYVDDSGRAYRYTAHEGTVLVSHSDDFGRNVRAVLNVGDVERFEIVDQVPAAK
jgi:hypothetical protein